MVHLNMRVILSLTRGAIDVKELKLWASVANGLPLREVYPKVVYLGLHVQYFL